MRRGRLLILVGLLLIVLLGGVAIVYFNFLQPAPGPILGGEAELVTQPQPTDLVGVVVVAQPVPRGVVINETHLSMVSIAREFRLATMFGEYAEVVGRKAKYDLDPGMLLTSSVLLDIGEVLKPAGSDWALVIEPGKVAVSIPISRLSSVSYAPQRGDHVDVIATLLLVDLDADFQAITPSRVAGVVTPGQGVIIGTGAGDDSTAGLTETETVERMTAQVVPGGGTGVQGRTEIDPVLGVPFYLVPSERQRPRVVSQSLLRNVTVLRVGSFPIEDERGNLVATDVTAPAETETPQGAQQQEPTTPVVKLPDVITLIVSPQDAVTLNYLIYSGAELTLALRAAGDENIIPTEAVTLQYLLDQYNIPVPARLPFGFEPAIQELIAPVLSNDRLPANP
jgi:Flp pilus assembly protein CpaB